MHAVDLGVAPKLMNPQAANSRTKAQSEEEREREKERNGNGWREFFQVLGLCGV